MTRTLIPYRRLAEAFRNRRGTAATLEGFTDHMLRDIGVDSNLVRRPASDLLFHRMPG